MMLDDPAVLHMLRRARVARIATLSRNGRPSVNPLYFIVYQGEVWLGTSDWTLAARNVKANPRVSLLFNDERHPSDRRVLRVSGQARVCTGPETNRPYNLRVAVRYLLPPRAVLNRLAHLHEASLHRYYVAENKEKGVPCVIAVAPETVEWIIPAETAG